MKKILVPIDFSACSENALLFAVQLADKTKAAIEVLNVASFDRGGMGNPSMISLAVEEQFRYSKRLMNKFIQDAIEKIPVSPDKSSIQAKIEMGITDIKICEIAANSKTDLIVMGIYEEHSVIGKYLGYIATKVLKNAPCSVLVIPESAEFKEQMVLGYATDLLNTNPLKDEKLLQLFQPEIKCVHFNEKQGIDIGKIKELSAHFTEVDPNLEVSFYSLPAKDAVKGINEFIEVQSINLLMMYKPRRNFFDALFHKSFTEKMMLHISIPLLIIKEKLTRVHKLRGDGFIFKSRRKFFF